MRIFLAGATGAIGRQLLPMLVEAGHAVTAMTRSPVGAEEIADQGGHPVVCDVFEADKLTEAMAAARPEAVIHELTSIPRDLNPRRIGEEMAATNRLRSEGTGILAAAARASGARRMLVQSVAFLYAPGGAGPATEEDPFHDGGPADMAPIVAAVRACERTALEAPDLDGVALRYGFFYGPGTPYARDGAFAAGVARQQVPIMGDGGGTFSFVHVGDAASATVAALEGEPGVYNVVDDEPAPVREWLPRYAELLGAPPPGTVPPPHARPAGDYAAFLMTEQRGASNRKARDALGWQPRYPTWREGFRAELATG